MDLARQTALTGMIVAGALLLAHCEPPPPSAQDRKEDKSALFESPALTVEELAGNRLSGEPTDFLRSRAGDAINWQPWTPALLETATAAQRPVFLVIGSGQITACHDFFTKFSAQEGALTRAFNENYVCSLADIEANPELALLAFRLCGETRQPFTFPMLLWLSHEGNPVAWLPIATNNLTELDKAVEASHQVVMDVWADSPRYFVENSRRDADGRRKRASMAVGESLPDRDETRDLLTESTGRLTALYDPATRAVDLGGGLLPSELLDATAVLARSAALPRYIRDRARRMCVEMHDLLADAPISDPLDGGLFVSRRSTDWSLPVFAKSAQVQSSAARSFSSASALGEDPRLAAVTREILAYQETVLGAGGDGTGSYRCLASRDLETELYFYTFPELETLLTPGQMTVAKVAFRLRERGNIPPAQDVNATYFMRSILFPARPAGEVAADLDMEEEEVRALIASTREVLRAHRETTARERDALRGESTRIAQRNADFALALLQAGSNLDDEQLISRGREQLQFVRRHFHTAKDGLWRIPPQEGRRGVGARGGDYAAALAAALEAYQLALNPEDLAWAESLARELVRSLADDDLTINEIPASEEVIGLPYQDASMLLGTSTWGTLYGSLERLRRISKDERAAQAADAIALRLLDPTSEQALVHTDFLVGLLVRAHDRVVVLHGDDAAQRDRLHRVLREPAFRGTVVLGSEALDGEERLPFKPPGGPGATVFRDLKPLGTFTEASTLRAFLIEDLAND